jgi:5-methyltetrahydrofolate--homocysteine methyltransferase
LLKGFAEQAKALAAGGADGIVIETMMDLAEAKAALRAVKENTSLSVAVTMTFNEAGGKYATLMGVRPDHAAVELERAGADIVGANCGAGIDLMIERHGDAPSRADLVEANAGLRTRRWKTFIASLPVRSLRLRAAEAGAA